MTNQVKQIDIDFVNAYKEIRTTIIPITGRAQFSKMDKKVTNYRSVADLYSTIPDILIKNNILMEVNLIEKIFPHELYEMVTPNGEVVNTVSFRRKYIGRFECILRSSVDGSEKKKIMEDVIDVLDPAEFGYPKAISCVTKDFLLNVFSIPSSDNSVERAPQAPKEIKTNMIQHQKLELIKDLKEKIAQAKDMNSLELIKDGFFSELKNFNYELSEVEYRDCSEIYNAHLSRLKPKEENQKIA
jgi:hypothetical protein